MTTLIIRDVTPADERAWRRLWDAYGDTVGTRFPDSLTAANWHRIMDPAAAVFALIAEVDGEPVALLNYVLHDITWSASPRCYLNDLYVEPAMRGQDIGGSILRFMQQRAAERGWADLHWLTHEGNARARRLYDRFTTPSGYIQYVIPAAPTP